MFQRRRCFVISGTPSRRDVGLDSIQPEDGALLLRRFQNEGALRLVVVAAVEEADDDVDCTASLGKRSGEHQLASAEGEVPGCHVFVGLVEALVVKLDEERCQRS